MNHGEIHVNLWLFCIDYRSAYTNYLPVQICVMWPNGEHGHYFTLVSMLQLMCKSLYPDVKK